MSFINNALNAIISVQGVLAIRVIVMSVGKKKLGPRPLIANVLKDILRIRNKVFNV